MVHKFTWNLTRGNFNSSTNELAHYLEAIQVWMGNKFKLNPDKTDFISIGDASIRNSMNSSCLVSLLDNIMESAESVKNIGVILDADN